MIAAGFDTARNVLTWIGALWTLSFGGLAAAGCYVAWRDRRTRAAELDAAVLTRLQADIDRMVERIPERPMPTVGFNETDVQRWTAELYAADPTRIVTEARGNRPYNHEIDG